MTTATPEKASTMTPRKSKSGLSAQHRAWTFAARYGTLAVLVLMIIGFGMASPDAFLSQRNLINILNQGALLAIIAGGVTFVLVVGQFDLSFANMISLSGILTVGLMQFSGLPSYAAIAITLAVSCIVGLFNGFLVMYLRMSSIVATLATSTILIGINFWYSNGVPVTVGGGSGFTDIARARLLGIPMPIIYMVVILAVLWVILNRTMLGHHVQAVGSNTLASQMAGVRVSRVTITAFVLASLCAGVAGIILSARIGSGQVTAGDGFLLSAFAAVFLGASVIRDGEFHIFGTFVGVLIVTVTTNGLSILGAPSFVQFLSQGGILIAAVALSTLSRRVLGTQRH
ncbi:ABC transporter permease [Arthrobacter sp. S39]|uniref:ABC transporter permease n=1 Tax=Arthrobacter sp. S39 TaxID=2509720 RepID=UPI0013EF725D|nr:ABC transporter permease [Arthrobacter sp. S39]